MVEHILANFTVADGVILAGNVAVLGTIVRKAWPLLTRLRRLLDDWSGEPARPGVAARPGVMVRLAELDTRTAQLQHNGGSTLRDEVAALNRDAVRQCDFAELRESFDTHIRESTRDRAALWQAVALGYVPRLPAVPVVPVAPAPPAPVASPPPDPAQPEG